MTRTPSIPASQRRRLEQVEIELTVDVTQERYRVDDVQREFERALPRLAPIKVPMVIPYDGSQIERDRARLKDRIARQVAEREAGVRFNAKSIVKHRKDERRRYRKQEGEAT